MRTLQTSILFAIIYLIHFVISLPSPSTSDGTSLNLRTVDVRAPIPESYELVPFGTSFDDNDALSYETGIIDARQGPSKAVLTLIGGVITALGGFASANCVPVITGTSNWKSDLACVVSGLAFITASLFTIWKLLSSAAVVEHYASVGMVAMHTSALIPDTRLLLAEHACTGQDCYQLWYHHNTTENTKMVSLVPKQVGKRQSGTEHDEPTSLGGLFMDYVWDNGNTAEERIVADSGMQEADQAIVSGIGQDEQYRRTGYYCAVWTEDGNHVDRGAIFQNQGSSYPYQSGQAASVANSCS